jgi:uncharacterized protein YuzE
MTEGTYPHVTYEDDILYIEWSDEPVARTREAGSMWVNVDEAADGRILSIEIIDASAGVDLRYLPLREEVERLIRPFNIPYRK